MRGRSRARGAIRRKARICRVGALLALAYPDRIAKNRGAGGAFLLANGRGANVDPASPLAREPFLAVAEITGTAAQGRIVLAAPLTLAEIEARFRRSHREPRRDRVRRRERRACARAACAGSARSRSPSSR